jgi:hypothetical protein
MLHPWLKLLTSGFLNVHLIATFSNPSHCFRFSIYHEFRILIESLIFISYPYLTQFTDISNITAIRLCCKG